MIDKMLHFEWLKKMKQYQRLVHKYYNFEKQNQ